MRIARIIKNFKYCYHTLLFSWPFREEFRVPPWFKYVQSTMEDTEIFTEEFTEKRLLRIVRIIKIFKYCYQTVLFSWPFREEFRVPPWFKYVQSTTENTEIFTEGFTEKRLLIIARIIKNFKYCYHTLLFSWPFREEFRAPPWFKYVQSTMEDTEIFTEEFTEKRLLRIVRIIKIFKYCYQTVLFSWPFREEFRVPPWFKYVQSTTENTEIFTEGFTEKRLLIIARIIKNFKYCYQTVLFSWPFREEFRVPPWFKYVQSTMEDTEIFTEEFTEKRLLRIVRIIKIFKYCYQTVLFSWPFREEFRVPPWLIPARIISLFRPLVPLKV